MDWFIDRLAAALTDPRTDLLLVLVLWLPASILVIAIMATAVFLIRAMVRAGERPTDAP